MQAYQAGVAALRISLKGITVERAENLVDQIQEVGDFCPCVIVSFSMTPSPGYIDVLIFLLPFPLSCVTLRMKLTRLWLEEL